MTKVPEKAQLQNFCSLCGVQLRAVARRNSLPLPGEPDASACATCLHRKGSQSMSVYAAHRAAELKAELMLLDRFLGSGPKLSRADKAKLDAAPLTGIALLRKQPESMWTDEDIEAMARDFAANAQNTEPAGKNYAVGHNNLDGSLNREHAYKTELGYLEWCREESHKKGGARTW